MTMTNSAQITKPYTRRTLVTQALGAACFALVRPLFAAPATLDAAIAEFTRGAKITSEKVKFDIAELIDNGNAVAITVSVNSPMTATNYVTAIAIFNEKNPQRDVAKFKLTPLAGRAQVSARIRLATSQKLVAIAEMNDGSFYSQSVDVIVTHGSHEKAGSRRESRI